MRSCAGPHPTPHLCRGDWARAGIAALGAAIGGISASEDEPTSRAALRSAGRLVEVGALGGIVNEAGRDLEQKVEWPLLPVLTGLGGFGYVATRLAKELETREGVIQRWTDEDTPASLPYSMGIGVAVAVGGRLLGRGYMTSRESLADYMGEESGPRVVGRLINAGMWAAGATALYGAVVARLARVNGKIETNFSTPQQRVTVGWAEQRVAIRGARSAGAPIRQRSGATPGDRRDPRRDR